MKNITRVFKWTRLTDGALYETDGTLGLFGVFFKTRDVQGYYFWLFKQINNSKWDHVSTFDFTRSNYCRVRLRNPLA